MHVFVDESERRTYLVCAVLVRSDGLDRARGALRRMRRPGERRIHFVKESPSRRRELLAAIADTEVRARIYTRRGPAVAARRACLEQLLDDLVAIDATRLVIESRQGRDQHDRQVLFAALRQGRGPVGLAYEHLRPHEDPLLWPADAIAWAYGAGGDWRRRVESLLDKATCLD